MSHYGDGGLGAGAHAHAHAHAAGGGFPPHHAPTRAGAGAHASASPSAAEDRGREGREQRRVRRSAPRPGHEMHRRAARRTALPSHACRTPSDARPEQMSYERMRTSRREQRLWLSRMTAGGAAARGGSPAWPQRAAGGGRGGQQGPGTPADLRGGP